MKYAGALIAAWAVFFWFGIIGPKMVSSDSTELVLAWFVLTSMAITGLVAWGYRFITKKGEKK